MADLPVNLPATARAERFARCIDVEGKIPRAFEALGPVSGRDVLLVDADRGLRARQLAGLGARVTAVARPEAIGLLREGSLGPASSGNGSTRSDSTPIAIAEGSAVGLPIADAGVDVLVGCWSTYRGPQDDELAEADRVLRPGGRLLVLHDYGRDDVSTLVAGERPEYAEWSRRDGTYLRRGFRIRVIHCFWTFESVDEAHELLSDAFGERGRQVAAGLKRPRLSYNVAIYHRSKGEKGEKDDSGANGDVAAKGDSSATGDSAANVDSPATGESREMTEPEELARP